MRTQENSGSSTGGARGRGGKRKFSKLRERSLTIGGGGLVNFGGGLRFFGRPFREG